MEQNTPSHVSPLSKDDLGYLIEKTSLEIKVLVEDRKHIENLINIAIRKRDDYTRMANSDQSYVVIAAQDANRSDTYFSNTTTAKNNMPTDLPEYNKAWTWYEKGYYFILLANRAQTAKQLAQAIKNTESDIDLANAQTAVMNSMQMRLGKTVQRAKLPHGSEYYYGLPEWFDGDKPREEYFSSDFLLK